MYQNYTAVGNLGSEPEMRYLQNGTPVVSFSLAVNERWTTAEGEKRESTLWMRITVWRALAENCAKFLHKGSKVLITGKLKPANAYTNKAGEAAASIEVTADDVRFLDSKPQDGDNEAHAPKQTTGKALSRQTLAEADIPF